MFSLYEESDRFKKGGENMAGIIKMSPEEVKTIAKTYGQSSTEIEEILSKLQNAQTRLAAEWDGDAFRAFEEQFNKLSPKVRDFAELMMEINTQLNKVAEIVRNTDAEIGKTINSASSGF